MPPPGSGPRSAWWTSEAGAHSLGTGLVAYSVNHGDTTNFRRAFADNCWQSNGNCSSDTAVHNAIDAAGGWSSTNTWDRLIDGLSGSVRDRMQHAADWNGTSEP